MKTLIMFIVCCHVRFTRWTSNKKICIYYYHLKSFISGACKIHLLWIVKVRNDKLNGFRGKPYKISNFVHQTLEIKKKYNEQHELHIKFQIFGVEIRVLFLAIYFFNLFWYIHWLALVIKLLSFKNKTIALNTFFF